MVRKKRYTIEMPQWYSVGDGERYAYCYGSTRGSTRPRGEQGSTRGGSKSSCYAVKKSGSGWIADGRRIVKEDLRELDAAGKEEVRKMVLYGARWEKVEKLNRGLKKVVTSDNGGQTFAVHYGTQKGEKRFRIYRIDPALRYLPVEMQPSAFTEYVTGGKYLKIFNPKPLVVDSPEPHYSERFHGSSILLQLSAKTYMYVGRLVIRFTVSQPITKFHPIVGHSAVHYCWAESQDWIYLVSNEQVAIQKKIWGNPNDIWADPEDAYYFYYHRWGEYLPNKKLKYKVYSADSA